MSNEFYIGYQKVMPPEMAGFLRRRVMIIIILVAVSAVTIAAMQHPFSNSNFEFGVVKTFSGIVHEQPYPTLTLTHPEGKNAANLHSCLYLVAPGKHGAQNLVAGLDHKTVTAKGSLIYRDHQTMIELQPDSIEIIAGNEQPADVSESLGEFTLRGEIVDSKCFLGVMKPGNLKPHKSCAIRCISGGITPVLCVRDEQGQAIYLMLAGLDNHPVNQDIISYVAEPVEITGKVERRENMLIMKMNPHEIRRL